MSFTNTGVANGGVDYIISDAAGSNPFGISGGAIISKSGAGTVTFMSPNTFTGSVSITAGQFNLQNSSALGTSIGVAVSSGAALQLQGGISIGSIPLAITGAGLTATPAGALQSVSGTNSYAGLLSIGGGGATITSSNSGDTLTLTGGITNNGNLVTISGAGNTTVSGGAITGLGGLTYTGSGILTLGAPSTYSGTTSFTGGTVRLASSSSPSPGTPVTGPIGIGTLDLHEQEPCKTTVLPSRSAIRFR